MSEADVVSLLGAPLSDEKDPFPEAWFYGEKRNRTNRVFDLFGASDVVFFDGGGRASKVNGRLTETVQLGMDREVVLQLAGPPDRKVPARARVFHYSAPANSGRYRARIVAINDHGTVSETAAYDVYD
jgi:hypothetical protein